MPAHLIAKSLGRSRERTRQILVKLGLPTDLRSRGWGWDICPVCGGKKRIKAKRCRHCYFDNLRQFRAQVPCYRCGKLIQIKQSSLKVRLRNCEHTFCSGKCNILWQWESGKLKRRRETLITLECFACHKVFQRSQREQKGAIEQGCRRAFCSRPCYLVYCKKVKA